MYEVAEVGYLQLRSAPHGDRLTAGEVGYLVANVRAVKDTRAGDTVFDADHRAAEPPAGLPRREVDGVRRPLPHRPNQYEELRDALEKLQLNDASLHYEPETSTALGFGFRCGFLGLLHMEIVQERLEREFDLDLVTTVPSVEYHVLPDRRRDGDRREPVARCRPAREIDRIEEPFVKARIMAPGRLHRRRS